jgi:hypothetical protein
MAYLVLNTKIAQLAKNLQACNDKRDYPNCHRTGRGRGKANQNCGRIFDFNG